jgi:hypothetical protein
MGRFKPREDPTRSEKLVNHLATRTATKHAEWQPDGAWAVLDDLDDLAADPLPPRPGMPSTVAGHSPQVRSSSTTIRSGCRTQ